MSDKRTDGYAYLSTPELVARCAEKAGVAFDDFGRVMDRIAHQQYRAMRVELERREEKSEPTEEVAAL